MPAEPLVAPVEAFRRPATRCRLPPGQAGGRSVVWPRRRTGGGGHGSRCCDRGDPQARGGGDPLRLSGQPHPGVRRARRHPADHRAPGADRPAHGGRLLAPHQRREDRRVRDAARAGRRERLWRRRPGLWRGGADPRAAHGLSAPHRACAAELLLVHPDERGDQVRRARDRGRRDRQHPAARLHAPAQRPRRAGTRRGAGRRVRRGSRRAPVLPAEPAAALRPRSGRGARGGQAPGRGQAPGDLCRPGHPLCQGLEGARTALRAARRPGHLEPRRQERVSRDPSARARLGRQRDPGDGRSLPQERGPDLRHRLQLHEDQFRRRHAARQADHPRHPRADGRQQGRRVRARPDRRCGADAAGPAAGDRGRARRRAARPGAGRARDRRRCASRGSPNGCPSSPRTRRRSTPTG